MIDNKVVGLGFDNRQFEAGTRQSLETIASLKKGLNFDESVSQLNRLSAASGSGSGIGTGLAAIGGQFSIMGGIGLSVIHNLTTGLMNFGRKLYSDMLIPMRTGMAEYELQMNTIQTIMANTAHEGTTLDRVIGALDELNAYSDKTIYNFGEMTRNIGTFTAAGVALDTSVSAIKGIANLAAISGSNSQQASTAMYQLSQGISAGIIRLQDWNSVVNAGMGGKIFQDALLETARVNGVAVDAMITKNGSFRESLRENWLTADVMLQTLAKFTGDMTEEQLRAIGYSEEQILAITEMGVLANEAATKVKTLTQLWDTLAEAKQSGWAKTWQLIIGDFDEAKELFTRLSDFFGDYINAAAESRNETLRVWASFGGRENLINGLFNTFDAFVGILEIGGEAFKTFFPGEDAWWVLLQITRSIEYLTEILKAGVITYVGELGRIFAGFFATLRMGADILTTIGFLILNLIKSKIKIDVGGILGSLASVGDYLVKLQETFRPDQFLASSLGNIKAFFMNVANEALILVGEVRERTDKLKEIFTELFEGISIDLTPIIESFKEFFSGVSVSFSPFQVLFGTLRSFLLGLLDLLVNFGPTFLRFSGIVKQGIGIVLSTIKTFFSDMNLEDVFGILNAALSSGILIGIQNFIKSGSSGLTEIGNLFKRIFDPGSNGLTALSGEMSGILDTVRTSLEAWQQNLNSKTLLNIAVAVGILVGSLLLLSTIDTSALLEGVGVITTLFFQLVGAQAALNKIGGMGVSTNLGLLAISTSLLLLTIALDRISKIDEDVVSGAIGVLYALLIGIAAFSKLMSKNKADLVGAGAGMIIVAISLLFLTEVVKRLTALSPEDMTQGLIGLGVMLAEIAAFVRLLDNGAISKGLGILALAASILVLSVAIEKLGYLEPRALEQGLLAIGAILAGLAAFTKTSSGGDLILTGVGIAVLGGAMLILSAAIEKLGSLSLDELSKGLGAIAAGLAIVAGAVLILPKTMIIEAAGLLAISAALLVLAEVITRLSSLTWDELGRGLVGIAGALLIIATALYAMTGTIAGSLALLIASASLVILASALRTLSDMSLEGIGLALLAIAATFVVLGLAGAILSPLLPTLLGFAASLLLIGAAAALVGIGLVLFSTGLMMLGAGGATAALGIAAFVTTLLSLLPVMISIIFDAVLALAEGIIRAAPIFADTLIAILSNMIAVILEVAPQFFEALGVILTGIFALVVEQGPPLINALLTIIGALLFSLAEKIPDFLQAGVDILLALLEGIRDNLPTVAETAVETIQVFVECVEAQMPDIIQAGYDLMIVFINSLAEAIENNRASVNEAVANLVSTIIVGLVEGLASGSAAVMNAMVSLANDAIGAAWNAFNSNSPSQEMIDLAKTIPAGIVTGLRLFGGTAVTEMRLFADNVIGAASAMSKTIVEGEFGPTIRPVLDMDRLVEEIKTVQKSFGEIPLAMTARIAGVIGDKDRSGSLSTPISPSGGDERSISFTQNNYSPKALSRYEIYRQTQQQLLVVKGVV